MQNETNHFQNRSLLFIITLKKVEKSSMEDRNVGQTCKKYSCKSNWNNMSRLANLIQKSQNIQNISKYFPPSMPKACYIQVWLGRVSVSMSQKWNCRAGWKNLVFSSFVQNMSFSIFRWSESFKIIDTAISVLTILKFFVQLYSLAASRHSDNAHLLNWLLMEPISLASMRMNAFLNYLSESV